MKVVVGHLWVMVTMLLMIIMVTYLSHQSRRSQEEFVALPNRIIHEIMESQEAIDARLKESEEIWKQGVKNRHAAELKSPLPKTSPYGMKDFRILWDFFYPDYNCPHNIERLGRVGDGGKWVCGVSTIRRQQKPCVVYSYGISGDTSFEKDVLEKTNCSLHSYDHTVAANKVDIQNLYPKRATFSKLGIGPKNTDQLRTLKTEMDGRGHTFMEILKLDVEGAEFGALDQIMSDFPDQLPFGQLIVELHLNSLPQKTLFRSLKAWWERLEAAGLRAFHNEPNLYIFAMAKGKQTPNCYEFSFLNVKGNHSVLRA